LQQFGDPAASVALVELAEPDSPAEAQALVELEYSPIHASELLMVRGLYGVKPPLPHGLGQEGVGRVIAVGPGVSNVAVGDRVSLPLERMAWRERSLQRAQDLVVVPGDSDPRQLCMLRSNPPTAALLLSEFADLQAGDWVIQNAANSHVGRCVCAFAKERGLKVVGLVRRAELIEELRAQGADVVLVDHPKVAKEVAHATGRASIRLGLDGIGGEATASLASCLGEGASVVSYAGMSGKAAQISPLHLIFRDITVRGFWFGHPRWAHSPQVASAVASAAKLVSEHRLFTPIAAEYALDEAPAAFAHVQRGGKVLFRMHPRI